MLAAIVLAAALATSTEYRVELGTSVLEEVRAPQELWYGGHVYVENEGIAKVRGSIVPKTSRGHVTIKALRVGRTRLMVSYVSGMNVYHVEIGTVIVECHAPAITVAESELRVLEGQPVTLHALTGGTQPTRVEWREGDTLLGAGNSLTIDLPRGEHRVVAVVENACGKATAEVDVRVVRMRRRAARH